MLCNRRGGCFSASCYKWGCECPPYLGSGGCCGGGRANIHQLMLDPIHKKMMRNSMQLVYGAYDGGCYTGCGCPPNPVPCPIPPPVPSPQEPLRIWFKCPTYCTDMPNPVITC